MPALATVTPEAKSHQKSVEPPSTIDHEPINEQPMASDSLMGQTPQKQLKPAATDEIHWNELSYDLGLQGLSQEIATNSIVGTFEQNHLQLFLTRDFMEFVNPSNQEEICQAIASKLGLSLILDLKMQDQLDAETPSETRLRQQNEHRLAAIESIKQAPAVKKLQRAFGAELVESSVKLIGENHNTKEPLI